MIAEAVSKPHDASWKVKFKILSSPAAYTTVDAQPLRDGTADGVKQIMMNCIGSVKQCDEATVRDAPKTHATVGVPYDQTLRRGFSGCRGLFSGRRRATKKRSGRLVLPVLFAELVLVPPAGPRVTSLRRRTSDLHPPGRPGQACPGCAGPGQQGSRDMPGSVCPTRPEMLTSSVTSEEPWRDEKV